MNQRPHDNFNSVSVPTADKVALVAEAIGIHRSFDAPDGLLKILRGVDLKLSAGRMVAITGASGAGKSTLLHILGGLDAPTSGAITWSGRSPYEMSDTERARRRNLSVGFVFQFHHLLSEFSAEENVALPLIIGGADHKTALREARAVMSDLGLAARLTHRPGELSGGEQQRTAVARALVTGAPLLIADEPSGNLDRQTAEQLHELLGTKIIERGCAIIVATHNPDLARRASEVYLLRDGVLHESHAPI